MNVDVFFVAQPNVNFYNKCLFTIFFTIFNFKKLRGDNTILMLDFAHYDASAHSENSHQL